MSVGPGLDYGEQALLLEPELCLAKEIEIAMSLLQSQCVIKVQFLKKDSVDKMSHLSYLKISKISHFSSENLKKVPFLILKSKKSVPFLIFIISGQLHGGEHPGPHGGGEGGRGDEQRGGRQRLPPLKPLREAVQAQPEARGPRG